MFAAVRPQFAYFAHLVFVAGAEEDGHAEQSQVSRASDGSGQAQEGAREGGHPRSPHWHPPSSRCPVVCAQGIWGSGRRGRCEWPRRFLLNTVF